MNIQAETSIRALLLQDKENFKAVQKAHGIYYEQKREIDRRIEEIRAARGTKIKEKDFSPIRHEHPHGDHPQW